jgi:hypothetical protein
MYNDSPDAASQMLSTWWREYSLVRTNRQACYRS